MAFAWVFPGQGSQWVGMGQATAERFPEAAGVWRTADEILGFPISRLAWEGPAGELDLTVNAQPATLAASVASHRALEANQRTLVPEHEVPRPAFYGGHSMGQYSAMVAAGVIDLADGLRLVRERGRLAQASAGEGAMAAIIGLEDRRVGELESAGSAVGVFTVANRNAPGQIVVSGHRRAVEAAAETARDLGARRVVMLPISVAAHSPLMADAAEGMRVALAGVTFRDPDAPLLANADARPLISGEDCRAELVEHLTRGVDWVRAVEVMAEAGVTDFVEVGPGRVLTGLIKRILPDRSAVATDDATAEGGLFVPSLVSAVHATA